jgi:hypothetical protein
MSHREYAIDSVVAFQCVVSKISKWIIAGLGRDEAKPQPPASTGRGGQKQLRVFSALSPSLHQLATAEQLPRIARVEQTRQHVCSAPIESSSLPHGPAIPRRRAVTNGVNSGENQRHRRGGI